MTATETTDAPRTSDRLAFPGIHPKVFEHPLDRSALEALRKTPGLDLLFKKLASLHFERMVRIHFTAGSLRLTPRQVPRVYNLLREASHTLDMEEPEFYLMQTPELNAFTIGMSRHTIVVTSGLLDTLNDDEMHNVLGHELGHIKSGHMLYRTMAIFLFLVGRVAARNLPFVNLMSEVLLYALYDWMRKSELTADRAGLLVSQNLDTALAVEMKLAGGARSVFGELDVHEFLKQADDYEDMDSSLLDMFYKFDLTRFQTHPFPALRARELHRWAHTDEYRAIIRGDYPRVDSSTDRRCGKCGSLIENPVFRFCPDCGAPL